MLSHLNRRAFLKTLGLGTAGLATSQWHKTASAAPGAGGKPNLIFILADDVGRDWIGCYGGAGKTPNIDRMAAEGVRFSTAWVTPLCTPTRNTLLTGRYPFRTGWIVHHDVPRWGGSGFDPGRETTFARVLKGAGYATAVCGKWQINDLRKQPDAIAQSGFDEHCLWTGVESGNKPSQQRYWNPYLQINGDRKTRAGKFGPDVVNEFLLDFLRRHKDGPFLAYYPMILCHNPQPDTPEDRAKGSKGGYASSIEYMDFLIGKVLAALDELGIADRTAVMFMGDNGSSAAGSFDGKAAPKGKAQVTDMGVHVPLVVRAPMLSKNGGRVCEDLVDATDLLPTLAELAGAPLPQGVTLDGHSFVGSVSGDRADADKRTWIYSQLGKNRILRDTRFIVSKGGIWDLSKDLYQKTNLRSSQEAEVVAARERLTKVLDSLPPDAPPPFKPFGGSGGKGG